GPMRTSCLLLLSVACAAAAFPSGGARLGAQAPTSTVALTGRVSSEAEGPMEGVLVTAKKAGSTIAVTVVTDRQVQSRFPGPRLDPAQSALRTGAAGYDLQTAANAEIAVHKTTPADLKLQPAADVAAQLTNAEWFASFPGTDAQKGSVRGCTHCH